MNEWLLLVTSLPTENATVRMRAWRTLKSSGAAVLRDGVYLMPALSLCRETLEAVASDVVGGGGTALLLPTEEPSDTDFRALFSRASEYGAVLAEIRKLRDAVLPANAAETSKQMRKLRKLLAGISSTDFFRDESALQCEAAMQELEQAAAQAASPDEPRANAGAVQKLSIAQYQGQIWATRRRPWIDRLASAWLIRRFIDQQAQIIWLDSPEQCPDNALGFDFDGARFSHVGPRVTFEVLVASFSLEDRAMSRLGALVHFLDVGGIQTPEALGIETVLAGLRESILDDNALLAAASAVFDGVLTSFALDAK